MPIIKSYFLHTRNVKWRRILLILGLLFLNYALLTWWRSSRSEHSSKGSTVWTHGFSKGKSLDPSNNGNLMASAKAIQSDSKLQRVSKHETFDASRDEKENDENVTDFEIKERKASELGRGREKNDGSGKSKGSAVSVRNRVIGILIALVSTFTNGSFSILSKFEPARSSGVEPMMFNFYVCLGVALVSFLPLSVMRIPFTFTWLGIISGFYLVISCATAFIAVKAIGVGIASGIWGGTAVLVSFVYGQIFDAPVANLPLAMFSILLLVISILGIAHSGNMAERAKLIHITQHLLESGSSTGKSLYLMGVAAAMVSGVTGGLILSPEAYAPRVSRGLAYIPSFGVGVLLANPIITAIPFIISFRVPKFCVSRAAPLGLCSGVIWNVGNMCTIVAIPRVGYSIAYPIMQCGLFIAGLWGIFLFGEIAGPYRKLYWASGFLLIFGAVLLAMSS